MDVNISIYPGSTSADLRALSVFCEDLALAREFADADDADDAPVTVDAAVAEPVTVATRKRRTKAEIAADDEIAATSVIVSEGVVPTAEGVAVTFVDTPPIPAGAAVKHAELVAPTAGPAAAAPYSFETTADKTFTEAEVQALATVVARAHGPDTVKDKIAELGGARIADLDAANLNILGTFLKSVK